MTGYAELQVTSNYSFLRGASHVEELVAQAKLLGLPAIAITDRNTLAGIARAYQRTEEAGIRLVVGSRLDLADNLPVLVFGHLEEIIDVSGPKSEIDELRGNRDFVGVKGARGAQQFQ